jgi:hypothetical protein
VSPWLAVVSWPIEIVAWAAVVLVVHRRHAARRGNEPATRDAFARQQRFGDMRRLIPLSDDEIARFLGCCSADVARWGTALPARLYQRQHLRRLLAMMSALEQSKLAPDAVALRHWLLRALSAREGARLSRVFVARGAHAAHKLMVGASGEPGLHRAEFTPRPPVPRWRSRRNRST